MEDIWSFGSQIFEDGLLWFAIKTVLVYISARIVIGIMKRILKKQEKFTEPKNMLILNYTQKTITTIIYVLVFISIFNSITPLQTIGKAALGATSILAVAVSLAAQETFSNYIAGFFIAIYHPFQVGDNISLPQENVSGIVSDITLRHTEIKTVSNSKILIPNSTMNTSILENRMYDQSSYTVYETVSVAYDSDLDEVKKVICDVLSKTDGILDRRSEEEKAEGKPIVNVQLTAFLDSALEIKFPITTESFSAYYAVAPGVREGILAGFARSNIEIPYNTVTVLKK